MSSIIDYFNANSSLSYTVSSSTPLASNYAANSAFSTSSNSHFETITSPYYWQISFSMHVSISSYIISGKSDWIAWPTSWEISYSLDDSKFTVAQTDEMSDFRNNNEAFPINPPIYCKHFKITRKTGTCDCLAFYRFDCFGSVQSPKRTRNLCTCNSGMMMFRPRNGFMFSANN